VRRDSDAQLLRQGTRLLEEDGCRYQAGLSLETEGYILAAVIGPGERIDGRYEVTRALGRGAMGSVLLARDEGLDRPVAIKLIGDLGDTIPDFEARFRKEAAALAKSFEPHLYYVSDVRAVAKRQRWMATGAVAVGALAVGACAIGSLAIGSMAIGRLAIGALALRRARAHSLSVDEVSIGRLVVGDLVVDRT
jgi:hypothetical protein